MFNLKTYADKQEAIDEMLNNKKGVCVHFAFLFKEIGEILDIKSHIIQGFTKQNGIILNLPLLNYSVSIQNFYDSKTEINKEKPFFNYLDTLLTYEKEQNL